jgi:hypothetical protein
MERKNSWRLHSTDRAGLRPVRLLAALVLAAPSTIAPIAIGCGGDDDRRDLLDGGVGSKLPEGSTTTTNTPNVSVREGAGDPRQRR